MKERLAAIARGGFGAVAALAGTIAVASAAPPDGPYLRIEGGVTMPRGMPARGADGLAFTLSPSNGPIAGAALGLRMAPFRLELDVDWMRADASSAHYANDAGLGAAIGKSSFSGRTVALDGTVQNIPVMLNGYFDLANGSRLEPYIGFGIGFTAATLDGITAAGASIINSSQRVFAYQPILGIDFALSDRLTAGLQYRYFASVDPSLADTAGHRFLIDNASHNVLATLTYHFLAPAAAQAPMPTAAPVSSTAPAAASPPPPPSPAPPPAALSVQQPPQIFFVFFNFNSDRLSAAGRHAADQAVSAYKHDRSNTIVVRGFTDLVGSDAYNLELSKRRALTVYRYLAAQGVKPADMGIDWQGKADPRVPTTKPERQNRRVEIRM